MRYASIVTLAALVCVAGQAAAQMSPTPPQGPQTCASRGAPRVPSIQPLPDGRITLSLCAPEATSVGVISADHAALRSVEGEAAGMTLTRDSLGRWSGTTAEPVPPGTYRYNFRVNGTRVPDPGATRFSEERTGINSLLEVAGDAGFVQDWNPAIAHGSVTEIEYWSASLGVKRRAHVYTPAGYMKDAASYPVLYLVHGAGDSDNSWSTVGHANYILDNLIASGAAKPMIVVMPFGHTPERAGAGPGVMLNNQDFGNDLLTDLIPHVESNFRTLDGPANRAMAGLSMGGAHTIRYGLTHPELFGYLGIFSMGLTEGETRSYATEHEAALRRGAGELKLVYFAMGKEDFLYDRAAPTRALLDRFGIAHVYNESGGGHTWINWRDYLADFAPRIFR